MYDHNEIFTLRHINPLNVYQILKNFDLPIIFRVIKILEIILNTTIIPRYPKKLHMLGYIHTIGQFELDRMIFFITKQTSVQFYPEEEKQDRIG